MDKETYFQIEAFLSFFSLDEFANLRSLTVIEVSDESIKKLRLMLSLISQLCCLNLPMSKLQLLSVISTNIKKNKSWSDQSND